jgi:hypothetical protein
VDDAEHRVGAGAGGIHNVALHASFVFSIW